MSRNSLLRNLTIDQRSQYECLTDEQERRLFLESLETTDLTTTPLPDNVVRKLPLPYSFLQIDDGTDPKTQALTGSWEELLTGYSAGADKRQLRELVNRLVGQQQELLQQQTDVVQSLIGPVASRLDTYAETLSQWRDEILKPEDIEQTIRGQIDANLLDVPTQLNGAVAQFVKELMPATIRVENPSDGLLRLTHYLTVALVVAGVGMGGFLFWGLSLQNNLADRTPSYYKYRYLQQKAEAEEDRMLQQALVRLDTLYTKAGFQKTLQNIENINAAHRQQQQYWKQENTFRRQLHRDQP